MKYINKILFISLVISFGNIFSEPTAFEKKKDQLKKTLDEAVEKVFINRPMENWGSDNLNLSNDQAKYEKWIDAIEEVGKFLKDSGSKELPVLYEKYFKPRYISNKDPFSLVNPKNDIVTDIFSQVALAYKNSKDKNLKLDNTVLSSLIYVIEERIKNIDQEINKVGTAYFDKTKQARDLFDYLSNNVLNKILENIKLKFITTNTERKIDAKSRLALQPIADFSKQLVEIAKKGSNIATLTGHTSAVSSVSFSPDGNYAISGSWDKTIKIWDLSNKNNPNLNAIATLTGLYGPVASVSFSPEGNFAISGSEDTIKLWDVTDKKNPKELATLKDLPTDKNNIPENPIVWDDSKVSLSRSKEYAVSYPNDTTIILRDVRNRKNPKELATFNGDYVNGPLFSTNNDYYIWGSSYDKLTLFVPDSNNNTRGKSLDKFSIPERKVKKQTLIKHKYVNSVSFSPDGKFAISGFNDDTIKLWDVTNKNNPNINDIATLTGHKGSVASVSFSRDGNYAISGSLDKTIKLWDVKDKQKPKELATLTGHTQGVKSVSFSRDGNYAISGSLDETIKLWDVKDKQKPKTNPIATLTGHNSWVESVSFSPDGNYAISGSLDKTIKLWDVKNKQNPKTNPIATLNGHTEGVKSVSFSPDGNYAISGSLDSTIKLWDLSFLKLTSYLILLESKDGIKQYLLLKSIIDFRKKQEDKKEKSSIPFTIDDPKLKELFKKLPGILKLGLIKEGYVKIK